MYFVNKKGHTFLHGQFYIILYFFFAGAFLAAFFAGALAAFKAVSTASTVGNMPKALSAGLIALNATGAMAASKAAQRSFGSVTPDMYSASPAPSTERP
jgi:hypothetical protein